MFDQIQQDQIMVFSYDEQGEVVYRLLLMEQIRIDNYLWLAGTMSHRASIRALIALKGALMQ